MDIDCVAGIFYLKKRGWLVERRLGEERRIIETPKLTFFPPPPLLTNLYILPPFHIRFTRFRVFVILTVGLCDGLLSLYR